MERDSNLTEVPTPLKPLSAAVRTNGRSISNLRISPKGDRVSFLSRFGGSAALTMADFVGGPEVILPLDPAPSSGGHAWLPNGEGLVYAAKDGRLYRFDFDSLSTAALTPEGHSAGAPEVSPGGSEAAYVVDDMAAIGIAPIDGSAPIDDSAQWPRKASTNADFATDPVWSPDGAWLAWVEWDNPEMSWDSSRIVVRRPDLSTDPVAVAGGPGIGVTQPLFSPDGLRLAFLSDETGWRNLWTVDTATFHRSTDCVCTPLVEETFEHGGPLWGPGDKSYAWLSNSTIVFSRNEHGWHKLMHCDASTGEVRALSTSFGASHIVATNGVATNGVATNGVATNGKAAFITSGSASPVTVSTYSALDDQTSVLARATPFGIERKSPEPELVSWHASDGTEIHGRLYRAAERAPMLVWIHVGPTGQSSATLFHRFSYFVERGWSIMVPDYRGSSGWGRAHQQALRGRWGEIDVGDVADGVRAAVDRGWSDPSKIVVVGGSAGGFTALLLLAKYSELFAAGVVMYPVCDLVDMTWTTWRLEACYNDTLIGPLPQTYDEYVARSPATHAAEISVPVLALHGSADPVVPLQQVEQLVSRIRHGGTTVEFHIYEGEGHGWRKPESRADELVRIERFLRRHVLHLGPNSDHAGLAGGSS